MAAGPAGAPPRLGVYGLHLVGLDAAQRLMTPQSDDAPTVRVEVSVGSLVTQPMESDDYVLIPLIEGGRAALDRATGTAALTVPREMPDEEILHPWFASAAPTFCTWQGRTVLHAGVVGLDGQAMVLVGHREAGKSSLLAWLALHSRLQVMADDIAVIDAGRVFAGPSCIDLRPGTMEHLRPSGARLVRDETRSRLDVAPPPASAALRAIGFLDWGPELRVDPVPAAHRLPAIVPHVGSAATMAGRQGLLDLVSVQVVTIRRPRGWEHMADVAAQVEALLTD